ncbi:MULTISPECIES: tRNA threonylcarbamoyladenosine dehydratase [Brevibacillus]|uniref:tRNA threonylcarbamoyladenosine dehydratase n=1 Tax=Brevibacillus nitrificans TaxID=651560 RepID=A0A3M8D1A2_9BACL|nr:MULTISPECIES: tRNA threonylcarbamoyladenosine dehydratase [Brevibacillus]MEC2131073.1 tRNA threonylcarbamoyladenosine dehydratase [Brevibacillus centrosporus]MED1792497.1 tRNA threonylcarbamoyladenosine dehydratase [Brevibacillus nitrificans]MED1952509.1 tRNA threonylcarbamoyladenosine dehydratase [Brevibacillus centrosporus]MED4907418.1 tRNA threonylcarbamoyladenosine dehydratase [Brevibacillus centrosporus]RNB73089.1 tRNA threonylcarbamoyladenosine dehydratase [Brevibacillus centrosporus]
MLHQFSRCELAFGPEGLEKMKNSRVAVLGIGGVGSFTVEALARTGVGKLVMVDKDVVDITNINRQIHATLNTVGQKKAELMKERIAAINPECEVVTLNMFFTAETADEFFAHEVDYIVDAMDTMSAKLYLIKEAKRRNIPIISSMGAANKMDPTRFEVADISQTSYDPIAKVIRRELRKAGIYKGVKVVYSREIPVTVRSDVREQIVSNPDSPISKVRQPPASNAFVPSVAGLILASVVVRDLLDWQPIKG